MGGGLQRLERAAWSASGILKDSDLSDLVASLWKHAARSRALWVWQSAAGGDTCGWRLVVDGRKAVDGEVELEVATWLILPVVIRSSQRLSHARLSKSNFTVKLRMAHYISYSLLDSTLLLGYP